ncbi:MAG: hypothetical protein KJN92_13215, partial [Gemmatimonadetes bacterium]|nr:hypothetical protein [Gemmatimonadota bacterium]
VWVMALTLPVTIIVKWLTPNAAFLDQMWVAGIALFVMLAGISLAWPEERPEAAPVQVSESEDPFKERDLLFDVLSIGAVVATVALVLFFW